jgi:outer membrane protein assembly factor BamB
VVAAGKLILFHRMGDRETIDCLDAASGKELWRRDYPTAYHDDFGFDEGPRATPAVDGGRVFTFGAEGTLSAFELATGAEVWRVKAREAFKAAKGFFGAACSPSSSAAECS